MKKLWTSSRGKQVHETQPTLGMHAEHHLSLPSPCKPAWAASGGHPLAVPSKQASIVFDSGPLDHPQQVLGSFVRREQSVR